MVVVGAKYIIPSQQPIAQKGKKPIKVHMWMQTAGTDGVQ